MKTENLLKTILISLLSAFLIYHIAYYATDAPNKMMDLEIKIERLDREIRSDCKKMTRSFEIDKQLYGFNEAGITFQKRQNDIEEKIYKLESYVKEYCELKSTWRYIL